MALDPVQRLITAFQTAITAVAGDEFKGTNPAIRPAAKPEHGDFQCNAAMALGKQLGRPPREVAAELIEAVNLSGLAETPSLPSSL